MSAKDYLNKGGKRGEKETNEKEAENQAEEKDVIKKFFA
jgi:hypothetical protein